MRIYNFIKTWRRFFYVGAGVLFGVAVVMALNVPDPAGELQRLKDERSCLNREIAQMEADLGKNTQTIPVKKPVLVAATPVNVEQFEHYMEAQGVVESDCNIVLSPKTEGVVETILVSKGDRVRKGQRLATIDDRLINANIEEVETSLELANSIFLRRQRLWDQKIGSEVDYLTAKNNKESLEKKLATLRQKLKNTRIVSPIDGEIDQVLIKEGEFAKKNSSVFRVIRLSKLKIKVDVSEIYAPRIKTGATVTVRIPGAGIEFQSSISAVSKVIDSRNRTLGFEVKVPDTQSGLKPNMLATVTLCDYSAEALTVPVHVVQKTGEQAFVFVVDTKDEGAIALRRFVKTGYHNRKKVEIVDGLSPGEVVVTEGFQDLSHKQLLILQH